MTFRPCFCISEIKHVKNCVFCYPAWKCFFGKKKKGCTSNKIIFLLSESYQFSPYFELFFLLIIYLERGIWTLILIKETDSQCQLSYSALDLHYYNHYQHTTAATAGTTMYDICHNCNLQCFHHKDSSVSLTTDENIDTMLPLQDNFFLFCW